ncbi:MAG: tetratricopeptide repeat protein [Methylomonas sp.]|jgi:tetratricopeptide (TPR) repeat protein
MSEIPDWDVIISDATALDRQGNYSEAMALYELLIKQFPQHYELLANYGTLLLRMGDYEASVRAYDQSLAINNAQAEIYSNRGVALYYLKRHDAAVTSLERAISLKPDYAQAYSNRGLALQELELFDAAIGSFQQALLLNPAYPEAYSNQGNCLQSLGRYAEAVTCYDKAIALNPNFTQAHCNRGNALKELQAFDAALAGYDQAIGLAPNYAEAYYGRAMALYGLKQYEKAIVFFDKAIALKPDYATAFFNCGIAYKELNQFNQVLAYFDQAIAANPDYAEAYSNRGLAQFELKLFEQAAASYDKAIALKPDFADAYLNKAILLLLHGDYWQGWRLYEWRFKLENQKIKPREYPQPRYLDQDLTNKTLFLYAEQGLGDTLQFCRYAKLLAAQGAAVILEVPSPLVALISTLDSSIKVIPADTGINGFDYHSPLLSLPHVFGAKVYTIPMELAYLSVDAGQSAIWKRRLGEKSEKKCLRIGLAWSGSVWHEKNKSRSIPLALFEKLLDLPFEFHSLQKEVQPNDLDFFRKSNNLKSHAELLDDFSETAALVWQMDVIISVDTSVAHLAGALGKPVWILLPHVPDFRWLLERPDTPWYASAKLYRQNESRDWRTVITKVIEDLANSGISTD